MPNRYSMTFVAKPQDIDENGHVNNAVWVRWMEDIATAHWTQDAHPEHVAAYGWVVARHEIDYRGNVREGDKVSALTEIRGAPSGARFERHITFSNEAGKPIVRAKTSWAMVDRETGKLVRVPRELAAPFLEEVSAGE